MCGTAGTIVKMPLLMKHVYNNPPSAIQNITSFFQVVNENCKVLVFISIPFESIAEVVSFLLKCWNYNYSFVFYFFLFVLKRKKVYTYLRFDWNIFVARTVFSILFFNFHHFDRPTVFQLLQLLNQHKSEIWSFWIIST